MIWRCLKITTYSSIHKTDQQSVFATFQSDIGGKKKNIWQPLISNSIQPLAAKANNIGRPPAVQHLAWKPQNPGINAEASGHEQSAKITLIASARPDGINYPEEQFVLSHHKKKKKDRNSPRSDDTQPKASSNCSRSKSDWAAWNVSIHGCHLGALLAGGGLLCVQQQRLGVFHGSKTRLWVPEPIIFHSSIIM